tara:strand:+ start:254 stop:394 length:141 start_codon:yes stop_codon:yes gene_type:complete
MIMEEEKIANSIKIAVLFLITLLGVSLTSESLVMVVLLFYIAFVKE